MKPKIIIIIAFIFIIIICAGVYFFITSEKNSGVNNITNGTNSGGTLPLIQTIANNPTSTLLSIGTPDGIVQVNNFYLSNPEIADGGETLYIASTSEYIITYSTIDSSFWIGIDPAQFNTVGPVAEEAFLSILGITHDDACKLNVSEGVFYSPTSSISGKSFPLSFCGVPVSSQ